MSQSATNRRCGILGFVVWDLNPARACRALKTKGNTPKYGLIFHSSFIGRAKQKNKGRISRYLANKCSIASRRAHHSSSPRVSLASATSCGALHTFGADKACYIVL